LNFSDGSSAKLDRQQAQERERMPRAPAPRRGGPGGLLEVMHLLHLLDSLAEMDRSCRRLDRDERAEGPGRGGHNSAGKRDAYKLHASPGHHDTQWYGVLLSKRAKLEDPLSKEHKEFVAEFRVPYQLYTQILEECRDEVWAKSPQRQCPRKKRGRPPCPLEYKVLGALYRLGCGCLNRTTARMFSMSTTSTEDFFKDFCAWYAHKYDIECTAPATIEAVNDVEAVYRRMGFPGCVGSVDGVHVAWAKCPMGLQPRHKGAKGYPSRSFNVTVDHRRMIQRVACSKPGAMNDVTSVRYDPHVTAMKDGLYGGYRYHLQGVETRGAYLLADGGYLRWRCLQCPRSHDARRFMREWSAALESIRKDVECTFGIMKGRFRILKLPFEFESETHIDNVFYTCCVLHNQIQRLQGFDNVWKEDVDWRGLAGQHVHHVVGVRHLGKGQSMRVSETTDLSRVGPVWGAWGEDTGNEAEQWEDLGSRLARHYDDARRHRALEWPKSQRWCARR